MLITFFFKMYIYKKKPLPLGVRVYRRERPKVKRGIFVYIYWSQHLRLTIVNKLLF